MIAGYSTSQVNSTPLLPPPYIIMGNVAWGYYCRLRSGMGGVRGEKKAARGSQKTFPPLQSTAQLALLPALRKGREGNLDTRPALPRARLAPLTRPKSPFRSFRAPASQASFLAASPRFLPFTMEPGHRRLKMELLNEKYGHK